MRKATAAAHVSMFSSTQAQTIVRSVGRKRAHTCSVWYLLLFYLAVAQIAAVQTLWHWKASKFNRISSHTYNPTIGPGRTATGCMWKFRATRQTLLQCKNLFIDLKRAISIPRIDPTPSNQVAHWVNSRQVIRGSVSSNFSCSRKEGSSAVPVSYSGYLWPQKKQQQSLCCEDATREVNLRASIGQYILRLWSQLSPKFRSVSDRPMESPSASGGAWTRQHWVLQDLFCHPWWRWSGECTQTTHLSNLNQTLQSTKIIFHFDFGWILKCWHVPIDKDQTAGLWVSWRRKVNAAATEDFRQEPQEKAAHRCCMDLPPAWPCAACVDRCVLMRVWCQAWHTSHESLLGAQISFPVKVVPLISSFCWSYSHVRKMWINELITKEICWQWFW